MNVALFGLLVISVLLDCGLRRHNDDIGKLVPRGSMGKRFGKHARRMPSIQPSFNSRYEVPGTGLKRYALVGLKPSEAYSACAAFIAGSVSSTTLP